MNPRCRGFGDRRSTTELHPYIQATVYFQQPRDTAAMVAREFYIAPEQALRRYNSPAGYPWFLQVHRASHTWRPIRDSNPSSPIDSRWPSLTANGPILVLMGGNDPRYYRSTAERVSINTSSGWRRERGSNPRTRICNPVPNHSAIPSMLASRVPYGEPITRAPVMTHGAHTAGTWLARLDSNQPHSRLTAERLHPEDYMPKVVQTGAACFLIHAQTARIAFLIIRLYFTGRNTPRTTPTGNQNSMR